jgi:hypothetical protein
MLDFKKASKQGKTSKDDTQNLPRRHAVHHIYAYEAGMTETIRAYRGIAERQAHQNRRAPRSREYIS